MRLVQEELRATLALMRKKSQVHVELQQLAIPFSTVSRGIRDLLEPVARYMRGRLYEALFEARSSHLGSGAQDLAFATSTVGSVDGGWTNEIFSEALELMSSHLDQNGHLGSATPFQFSADMVRITVNAHALMAMAHVWEQVAAFPSISVVERMVSFFSETARHHRPSDTATWCVSDTTAAARPSPWLSALSVLSLHRVVRMLDRRINERVRSHFPSRSNEVPPAIDDLMCTDIGVSAVQDGPMATEMLERMRAQLLGRRVRKAVGTEKMCSLILHGPPGTGKTTLPEALARSARVPLIVVTPSDLLTQGLEGIERQTGAVMSALSTLTEAVILFDEFDSILHKREDAAESARASSILDFMTGGMLPRLAQLHRAAIKNSLAYFLATNYLDRIEEAAVRPGRFDDKIAILYPDVPSRICRLVAQLKRWLKRRNVANWALRRNARLLRDPRFHHRVALLVAESDSIPAVNLCVRGFFTEADGLPTGETALWYQLVKGLSDARSYNIRQPREQEVKKYIGNDKRANEHLNLAHDWDARAQKVVTEAGKSPGKFKWRRFTKEFLS
jgi:hypothetical protein